MTKSSESNWAHIKPEVFSLITEAVTSGETIVNTVSGDASTDSGQSGGVQQDTAEYDEKDAEVVGMIRELLETRIRPAIQEDGGDIEFRGFNKEGMVSLKLRGACRTCDSSTVTLRNGIENMLMHYVCLSFSFPLETFSGTMSFDFSIALLLFPDLAALTPYFPFYQNGERGIEEARLVMYHLSPSPLYVKV